nr:hypothetical protein GCM10020241_40300 [Streptoalloteichus tenebrarius]
MEIPSGPRVPPPGAGASPFLEPVTTPPPPRQDDNRIDGRIGGWDRRPAWPAGDVAQDTGDWRVATEPLSLPPCP